jgi:hypothetical protein
LLHPLHLLRSTVGVKVTSCFISLKILVRY